MLEWIQTHEPLFLWAAVLSILIFTAFLAFVPWLVVRIPEDYFAGHKRPEDFKYRRSPITHVLLLTVKNIAGFLLVLAGIAMLVLPGQGVLTIMLGIALMNFPGKFKLERWIVSRGPVIRMINRLRRGKGRPELVLPAQPGPREDESA